MQMEKEGASPSYIDIFEQQDLGKYKKLVLRVQSFSHEDRE